MLLHLLKIQRFHLIWPISILGLLAIFFTIKLWQDTSYPGLPDRVDFNYHIRPILSQNCYACHGPDKSTREADLRLDQYEEAIALRKDGGFAVVPGKPHKSLMVERINSTDPGHQMPPPESKKTLTAKQIALLERWIDQGAEWKDHWAFLQPEQVKLPRSLKGASTSKVLDHLLEKEHKRLKIKAIPESEPESLIRRLSYVLTGLPPSSEAVNEFVQNYSQETYESAVNAYMSSPHFGERWARHWMDVVRYSESAGHEDDAMIGGAWRYRDYLIRAFNEDLPYDQFVLEHLAGDLLPSPRYHTIDRFNESVLGTAFICLGEAKSFPVNLKQEETERIHHMIDVSSLAFQALTVGCARCHDHKFDPIPTTDYYAMYGMWESSRITPHPASMRQEQLAQLEDIEGFKQELMRWMKQKEDQNLIHKTSLEYDTQVSGDTVPDSFYRILGDFRKGSWPGWHSDGQAFGAKPVYEEVVFEPESKAFLWVENGYASSRKLVSGLSGALRSPNFIIEHDSILIRARGNKGSMRVIIENYQPINDLLYGGLHIFLENPDWQDYAIHVSTWKGYQAYIEFLPGVYEMQSHKLKPEDYIEAEYVAAFNGSRPDLSFPTTTSDRRLHLSKAQRKAWIGMYDSLTNALYDSTHFVGLTRGEAIFSPVHIRGDFKQPEDEGVPHGFLSAIKAGPENFPQDGNVRLAWAQSVVDPNNPLTARIMVNRLWHYVFGRGLVETMDNFGVQGKLPSHPELLDYLALQFVEEGWSMKAMIRHMVMSTAFRRSTRADSANVAKDKENIFLHHYPVRRLEAEALRDGVLAISGQLDSTLYGEPIMVDYTPFLASFKQGLRPEESGPLDGAGRRSIYQMIRRNYMNPLMITFDTPIPFGTVGARNVSYTPAQSLSLLNDPFFHEQAKHWAVTLLKKEQVTEERIKWMYLQAFSRNPSKEEMADAMAFLNMQALSYELTPAEMNAHVQLWTDYCHSIFNLKEFIHIL
ncbi:MAG: PSD1 and planctomycete cytochrome C domain-containing protein [Bacteroidota bacterium]